MPSSINSNRCWDLSNGISICRHDDMSNCRNNDITKLITTKYENSNYWSRRDGWRNSRRTLKQRSSQRCRHHHIRSLSAHPRQVCPEGNEYHNRQPGGHRTSRYRNGIRKTLAGTTGVDWYPSCFQTATATPHRHRCTCIIGTDSRMDGIHTGNILPLHPQYCYCTTTVNDIPRTCSRY